MARLNLPGAALAHVEGDEITRLRTFGKALIEHGLDVEVLPMSVVEDLEQCRAVVAGSAIQDSEWLPEAMEFVRANQAELSRRPLAAVFVCMTLAMKDGEKHRPFVGEFLAPVRALVQPVSEGLFAGALSILKVPYWQVRLMFRLSVLFGVWKEGDHRDWNAIRSWAGSLPAKLTT